MNKRKRLAERPVYNTRMMWYQVSMMDERRTDEYGYELLSDWKKRINKKRT